MITDDELKRANHLRVYIIHGDEDSLVAPQEAAAARTTLEAAGFNVTARSFAGGHRIPDEVLPSVNEWLMGKPEPAPAAIADSHAADV